MKLLTNKIKNEIIDHALKESPNECCGVIYRARGTDEAFLKKCKNVALNKLKNFRVNPLQYMEACKLGDIVAYYHSHVDDEKGVLSDPDKKVSRGHGLPLIMYCIKKDLFVEYNL
tara:strand:- start:626 stop:970 length:345 start_codon:yes stop_codon:yes gene_type:complete